MTRFMTLPSLHPNAQSKPKQPSKYHNEVTYVDSIRFDSKHEADRYAELKLMEMAGAIKDLKLQVPFEIVPAYVIDTPTNEVYRSGKNKGKRKIKREIIEKAVNYVADFVYTENGKQVVEDAKGKRTDVYIIKRKLMLHVYGIRIREV